VNACNGFFVTTAVHAILGSNILQISVTSCCQLAGLSQASGYRRRQWSSLCLVLLQVCQESEENCKYNYTLAALIMIQGLCHWPLSLVS